MLQTTELRVELHYKYPERKELFKTLISIITTRYKVCVKMVLIGRLTSIETDPGRLTPRLVFKVEYENGLASPISICAITGDVLLKENGSYGGLATLSPCVTMISILPKGRSEATLYLDLDHHKINIVEELRKGGDFIFKLDTHVLYSKEEEDGRQRFSYGLIRVQSSSHKEDLEIPQSKWVRMLEDMGYARFRVIELPIPEPPKGTSIDKSIGYLKEALRSFHEGDYDDVLSNCRKAINQAEKILNKEELGRILKSSSKTEKVSGIRAKIKDFTQLGPHISIDTKVDQRDAELALHCTTSLMRYLARNLIKGN